MGSALEKADDQAQYQQDTNAPPAYAESDTLKIEDSDDRPMQPLINAAASPHTPPTILHPDTRQPLVYTLRNNVLFIPASGPCLMFCPTCHREVLTRVIKKAGCLTYASSLFLCIVCWPLSCLPFCCCPSLKDDQHICSQCDRVLGYVPA